MWPSDVTCQNGFDLGWYMCIMLWKPLADLWLINLARNLTHRHAFNSITPRYMPRATSIEPQYYSECYHAIAIGMISMITHTIDNLRYDYALWEIESGYNQSWYCVCRTTGPFFSIRMDFDYLRHINVVQ